MDEPLFLYGCGGCHVYMLRRNCRGRKEGRNVNLMNDMCEEDDGSDRGGEMICDEKLLRV